MLDQVQKGLSDYLETKRSVFARFYFLSNDELLGILSESKDVLRMQPHFKKCFEGIDKVEFQEDLTITAVISPEGEKVPLVHPVDPKNKNVEVWLLEVSTCDDAYPTIAISTLFLPLSRPYSLRWRKRPRSLSRMLCSNPSRTTLSHPGPFGCKNGPDNACLMVVSSTGPRRPRSSLRRREEMGHEQCWKDR